MPVPRRPGPPSAKAAPALLPLLLLALASAGCAGRPEGGGALAARRTPAPPGFSADTFTRAGLVSGATATEAGCRALPDGIWVDIGHRRECLRYAAAGTGRPARTAIVHFPGDPAGVGYRSAGNRVEVDHVSEVYEQNPGTRRLSAEVLAGATGGAAPVFLMARPGMHGASGDHARDRHTRDEVALLDAALDELKRRHGVRDFALAGFSSGGAIVANLLARRSDVRCAAIASAPLDLTRFHRQQDGAVPDHVAMRNGQLADPMRSVGGIRSDAAVFVIGDTRDRSVPHAAWEAWEAAARRRGLRVFDADVAGFDRPELGAKETHHITQVRGLEAAHACAAGAPGERVQRALAAGEPILEPRGRRLGGEEIRAAFAGRRMAGILWAQWGVRAAVSAHWDPGGERHQFHPARPERRTATRRWWVEGDRLCTAEDGCHAVLADGRFLHVVDGEPPRFLMTFAADAHGG
jgi:dienelactone hydrolase